MDGHPVPLRPPRQSSGAMNPARVISSTPVIIKAPAALVWSVLVDLPRYGKWNPLNRRAESDLQISEPIRLWISDAAILGEEAIYEHHIFAIDAPFHLAWGYSDASIRTRRDQYLAKTWSGGTVYRTSDSFDGPGADAALTAYGAAIAASFDRLAAALKARCENLHQGASS